MPNLHVLRTELTRTVTAIRDSISEKGLLTVAERVAAVAGAQAALPLTRMRRADCRFEFRGHRLPYTFARYNNSFLNERTVEISIARWFLTSGNRGRMLEVGNVLEHYGLTGHTVLDKYEVIPGVLNADIADFRPETPFDTVIAISTLEHVGWDESPREPEKIFRAIANIKECVRPGGRLLVTMPIGHNAALDEALGTGEIGFSSESWMIRTNRQNEWVESDRDQALTRKYGSPYPNANAVYVGMIGE